MPEAYIVDALRSPTGKRKGGLAHVHAIDLGAHVLKALVERNAIPADEYDDVIFGCVDTIGSQAGDIARTSWLAAGLPLNVPGTTIDRQCGSSQQALHFAAQAVMSGTQDVIAVGGVQTMTQIPISSAMLAGQPLGFAGQVFVGVSRAALEAMAAGRFVNEIVPCEGVRDDETPRQTSLAKMAELEPVFAEFASITAAVSSQTCDASAALLVVSEAALKRYNLTPRARIHHLSVLGDDPIWHLRAPIAATRAALKKAGMGMQDIDLVEINEAFASVVMAWAKELDFDPARTNANGGAIALGHPLGASGARLMTGLLNQLEHSGGRYGLQTMCEGGGQANVTIIERL